MQAADPIIIKLYAGSRLYDTQAARYVALDDLAGMLRSRLSVAVLEASSGRDITQAVLAGIISGRH